MGASSILPSAKTPCGEDWYRDMATLPDDVSLWVGEDVQSWALIAGDALGIPPAKCFSSFKANFPIDGKVFSSIEYHELREMGFNVGESKQVAAVISDYFFGSYQSPPYETYHRYSPPGPDWPQMQSATGNMEFQRTLVEERPIEVATTAVLEALIGIDQVNFYFEAQFLLVMSWRDERINTKCVGAGSGGVPIPSSDRCAHYWTPQTPPIFPSMLSVDGNPAVEILEDLGLFTIPGTYRIDCGVTSACPPSTVNVSMGYRMLRIRGSFGASMEFRRFPYDRQDLEILLRAPAWAPRAQYRMVPNAAVDPAILELQARSRASDPNNAGKDVIAGWRVVSMTASERPLLLNTTIWDPTIFSGPTTADPLFNLMEAASAAGEAAVADAGIPYYSIAVSEASFVLHVCRIPSSYIYNFIFLVTLLEMIALVSYLLHPDDLDPRVNMTLTVFLGVIFFQIMLSDLLPTTGYLTDMHLFTFFSTVLVVAVALTHVFVFAIQKKAKHKLVLLQRLRQLRRSRRAVPAVMVVQRRVRVYLAQRRMRARLELTEPLTSIVADGGSSERGGTKGGGRRVAPTPPKNDAGDHRTVLAAMYGGARSELAPPSRWPVLQRLNEALEHFCVILLGRANVLFALAFACTYVVMMFVIFSSAFDHPSECY